MNITEFKTAQSLAIADAKKYVDETECRKFRNVLEGVSWDKLYDEKEPSDINVAFSESLELLTKELAAPIVDKVFGNALSEDELFKELDKAEEKFYYRQLNILGKQPHEASDSWVAKHLCRHSIVEAIRKAVGKNDLVRKAEKWGYYSNHEAKMIEKIYDIPLTETVISFFSAKLDNMKISPFYKDFAARGKEEEFLSVILNFAENADGFYPEVPKNAVINHVVAGVARIIYRDASIGSGDISMLRDSGVIKPLPLWDSTFFNENQAPKITDEMVKEASKLQSSFICDTFLEIKDELSDREILSYLMGNSSQSYLSTWEMGMTRYEVVTGNRLSMEDARSMKPHSHFAFANTKAYSDQTDREVAPDKYRDITVDIERDNDAEEDYDDCEKAVRISILCDSLRSCYIESEFSDESLNHDGISRSGSYQDGYWFELITEDDNFLDIAKNISLKLVAKLEELNLNSILPGDVIKVNSDDAGDYDLKNGKLHLVTDIDSSHGVKLKGDVKYYPVEIFEIKKKHKFEKELDATMGL